MSALPRLRRAQAALAAAALAAALLWGAAAWLLARLALAAGGAAVLAAAAAGVALWRRRRVASAGAVALWVEERRPELRYALVTLADPAFAGEAAALERSVAPVRWSGALLRAAALAVLPPLALTLALLAAPRAAGTLAGAGSPGAESAGAGGSAGASLSPLRVRVSPPAYTGRAPREERDPAVVAVLAGSRVEVEGPGGPGGLAASLGEDALPAESAGERWRVGFAAPERPTALRLRAGSEQRILAIEPYPDSVPRVALLAPRQDTVLREPRGSVEVRADARDDFGLRALRLEYIVSSGEGESFTFRSGVLAGADGGGRRAASVAAALSAEALELRPGDVVHLRAVARDANAGEGFSETRALRVARAGEYDSVAVEAAPPPEVDRSALSQRMLIRMAEALESRRAGLPRATVVAESRAIAADQARLRGQVGDVIFMRLGGEAGGEHSHSPGDGHDHAALTPDAMLAAADAATGGAIGEATDFHGDETPVVAINQPLLEAYNAMWAAGGELQIGEPDDALPHMRAALRAIQRAREAERLYLRGRMPLVVVDLDRVRLAGEREGADPSRRAPRPPADSLAARRLERFDAALRRLPGRPAAAADSLLLLRLDLVGSRPAAAAALADAAERLRRGGDATDALVRARRALAGAPVARPGLPAWLGGGGR